MPRARTHAFTLIELLVVISIIALLIAILMPALQKARESAGAVVCMSNVSQMGKANEMFANDHDGHYPYNYWLGDGSEWVKKYQAGPRERGVYWMVDPIFLEYMGFTDEQINNVDRGGNANESWGAQWPDQFLCPQWEDDHNIYNHRNSYGYSRGRRNKTVNVAERETIPHPAEAYAHMDAQGWHVLERMADYRTGWDVYGNTRTGGGGIGNVKYRHEESANVSYFDGHAEQRHKADMFHHLSNGSTPDKEANARHWVLKK